MKIIGKSIRIKASLFCQWNFPDSENNKINLYNCFRRYSNSDNVLEQVIHIQIYVYNVDIHKQHNYKGKIFSKIFVFQWDGEKTNDTEGRNTFS